MAKKSNKPTQPNPAVRLSTLGPRLNQLARDEALNDERCAADLNRLTMGLKPASFLPILVNTVATLTEEQQQALKQPLLAWLQAQELLQPLQELEAKQTLLGASRRVARDWLERGGVNLEPVRLAEPQDLFIHAYKFGSPSQASLALFWYKDERQRQVQILNCLIDYEPPWDGSLKDVDYRTFRDTKTAIDHFLAAWSHVIGGAETEALDLPTAMYHFWGALRQNQAQAIRLPTDFIKVSNQILPTLWAFPPHPEVPALSADEMAVLAQEGRSPEAINADERRFGYQTRLRDGSVVRIIRSLDDD